MILYWNQLLIHLLHNNITLQMYHILYKNYILLISTIFLSVINYLLNIDPPTQTTNQIIGKYNTFLRLYLYR